MQNSSQSFGAKGSAARLCLDQIYGSTDPAVADYTRQVCLEELGRNPKNFGAAFDRAVMRVALKFAHKLPADQQALLAAQREGLMPAAV